MALKKFEWSPSNINGTLSDMTSAEETKFNSDKNKAGIKKSSEVDSSTGVVSLFHNNSAKLETHSSGVTITGTANVDTVDLGNWTITESGGVLYFATGGTNKMKLDASGNLTVVGDVSAFGTV